MGGLQHANTCKGAQQLCYTEYYVETFCLPETITYKYNRLEGLAKIVFPVYHQTQSYNTLQQEVNELRCSLPQYLYPEQALHAACHFLLQKYAPITSKNDAELQADAAQSKFLTSCNTFFKVLLTKDFLTQVGCQVQIIKHVGQHLHVPRQNEHVHFSNLEVLKNAVDWYNKAYSTGQRQPGGYKTQQVVQLMIYLMSCSAQAINNQLVSQPNRHIVQAHVDFLRHVLSSELFSPIERAQIVPQLVLIGSRVLEAPKDQNWSTSWLKSGLIVASVSLLESTLVGGLGGHVKRLNGIDFGPMQERLEQLDEEVMDDEQQQLAHDLLQNIAKGLQSAEDAQPSQQQLSQDPKQEQQRSKQFDVSDKWLDQSDGHVATLIQHVLTPLHTHPSTSVLNHLALVLSTLNTKIRLPKLRAQASHLLLTLAGQNVGPALTFLDEAIRGEHGPHLQEEARRVGEQALNEACNDGLKNALVSEEQILRLTKRVKGGLRCMPRVGGRMFELVQQLVGVWGHGGRESADVLVSARVGGVMHQGQLLTAGGGSGDVQQQYWMQKYPRYPCGLSHVHTFEAADEVSRLCVCLGEHGQRNGWLAECVSMLSQQVCRALGVQGQQSHAYYKSQKSKVSHDEGVGRLVPNGGLEGSLYAASALATLQHMLYGALQVHPQKSTTHGTTHVASPQLLGAVSELLTSLVSGPLSGSWFADLLDVSQAPNSTPGALNVTSTQLQGLPSNRLQELSARGMVQKYSLEIVGVCAGGLGDAWQGRLMDTCMLPVLEAMAGGLPIVRQAAKDALLVMAQSCGNPALQVPRGGASLHSAVSQNMGCGSKGKQQQQQLQKQQLELQLVGSQDIVDLPSDLQQSDEEQIVKLLHVNQDYLVSGLALRIRKLHQHPQAPALFGLLFSHLRIDSKLLPSLAGPMQEVFKQLSMTQRSLQDVQTTASYARILQSVCEASSRSASDNLKTTQASVSDFKTHHLAALEELNDQLKESEGDPEFQAKLAQLGYDAWRLHVFTKHISKDTWYALQARHSERQVAANLLGTSVDLVAPLLSHTSPGMAVLAANVTKQALSGLRSISAAMRLDQPLIDELPKMIGVISPPLLEPPMVLPKVHESWPYVLHTLRSPRAGVVEAGIASVAHVVSVAGGQFLAPRFASEAWPLLQHILCTPEEGGEQQYRGSNWVKSRTFKEMQAWDPKTGQLVTNHSRAVVQQGRRVLLDSGGQQIAPATLSRLQLCVLRCLHKVSNDADTAKVLVGIVGQLVDALMLVARGSGSEQVLEASLKLVGRLPHAVGEQAALLEVERALRALPPSVKNAQLTDTGVEAETSTPKISNVPTVRSTGTSQDGSQVLTSVVNMAARARQEAMEKRMLAESERVEVIRSALSSIVMDPLSSAASSQPSTQQNSEHHSGTQAENEHSAVRCEPDVQRQTSTASVEDRQLQQQQQNQPQSQELSLQYQQPQSTSIGVGDNDGAYQTEASGSNSTQAAHDHSAHSCHTNTTICKPDSMRQPDSLQAAQRSSPSPPHTPPRQSTPLQPDKHSLQLPSVSTQHSKPSLSSQTNTSSKPNLEASTPKAASTQLHQESSTPKVPASETVKVRWQDNFEDGLFSSDDEDDPFAPSAIDEAIAEQNWKLERESKTGVDMWGKPYERQSKYGWMAGDVSHVQEQEAASSGGGDVGESSGGGGGQQSGVVGGGEAGKKLEGKRVEGDEGGLNLKQGFLDGDRARSGEVSQARSKQLGLQQQQLQQQQQQQQQQKQQSQVEVEDLEGQGEPSSDGCDDGASSRGVQNDKVDSTNDETRQVEAKVTGQSSAHVSLSDAFRSIDNALLPITNQLLHLTSNSLQSASNQEKDKLRSTMAHTLACILNHQSSSPSKPSDVASKKPLTVDTATVGEELAAQLVKLRQYVCLCQQDSGLNVSERQVQVLVSSAFCYHHLHLLLPTIAMLYTNSTTPPSNSSLPNKIGETHTGSIASHELFVNSLASLPLPLLISACQQTIRTVVSSNGNDTQADSHHATTSNTQLQSLLTFISALLLQATDFNQPHVVHKLVEDIHVLHTFGYLPGGPDTTLRQSCLNLVLLPEWLSRYSMPRELSAKAYWGKLLNSLGAEQGPSPVFSRVKRVIYGHVLLKLCLRGDEAVVVDHLLLKTSGQDEAKGSRMVVALKAFLHVAFPSDCSGDRNGTGYQSLAQSGAVNSSMQQLQQEALKEGIRQVVIGGDDVSDPGVGSALRRLLLKLLQVVVRVMRQRSQLEKVMVSLVDKDILFVGTYQETLAQVISEAYLPQNVLDLIEHLLTSMLAGATASDTSLPQVPSPRTPPITERTPSQSQNAAEYSSSTKQSRFNSVDATLLNQFLKALSASAASRFCNLNAVQSSPPRVTAYTTHVLLLCLHVHPHTFHQHLGQILEGITARYDCQEEVLLGQGNRVLCAVSKYQPVDLGSAVTNSPLLPSEKWADDVTWDKEPVYDKHAGDVGPEDDGGVLRCSKESVQDVFGRSAKQVHKSMQSSPSSCVTNANKSPKHELESDSDDSDAGSDGGGDGDADVAVFTDSDDSDASSEDYDDNFMNVKDVGIASNGKVWTLPSLLKALRHKDDIVGRMEALQAVEGLVKARPVELEIRAEELFRQVLYTDVPNWSRPTSGNSNHDIQDAMQQALQLDQLANNKDPSISQMAEQLIPDLLNPKQPNSSQTQPQGPPSKQQTNPLLKSKDDAIKGKASSRILRPVPAGEYDETRDPMVLKLRGLSAIFAACPATAGTAGLMTAGMGDLDVTQRMLIIAAVQEAADQLASCVRNQGNELNPKVGSGGGGGGVSSKLEVSRGSWGGPLGSEKLEELSMASEVADSGVSTVLLNDGKLKVHLRSLMALQKRKSAVVSYNALEPLAVRWARILCHVGAEFVSKDSPLFTLIGQQVMQTLGQFCRLTHRSAIGIDVALETLAYGREFGVHAATTSMSKKVLLGMIYTAFCSFTPPALAGVLSDDVSPAKRAVLDSLEWVQNGLKVQLEIGGEEDGEGGGVQGSGVGQVKQKGSDWLASATEREVYEMVVMRGVRSVVAAVEWGREQKGVELSVEGLKGGRGKGKVVLLEGYS